MYKSPKFHRGNSYSVFVVRDGQDHAGLRRKMRRVANKAVRRYEGEIPSGSAYKKLYASYDISDFSENFMFDLDEAVENMRKKTVRRGGKYYIAK